MTMIAAKTHKTHKKNSFLRLLRLSAATPFPHPATSKRPRWRHAAPRNAAIQEAAPVAGYSISILWSVAGARGQNTTSRAGS